MDVAGAGHGTGDMFTFQARSHLDQIAGIDELPRCTTFAEAAGSLEILTAIAPSAGADGAPAELDWAR